MVLATDEDSRVAMGYDSQGNMLSDTQREPGNLSGLDVPVVCTVNALGQPLTCTVPDGGRGTRVITSTYHGNDLLATVRDTAVSAATNMAQVDWWGDVPFQWVTGINQPVTARTNFFDGISMLPYQQTLVKNGVTMMDYMNLWHQDGASALAYVNQNAVGVSTVFNQSDDMRLAFQGCAWSDGSDYSAIDRDKNTNLTNDNNVAQVFNTRNGQTSRNSDPWVRDNANFVKDITEGTTRRHFITDVLGHVVGFERYVSEVLQESWLYRFDATGRRISKSQTVGGSGYLGFVHFGDTMMETRTPWSTTLNRFGHVGDQHLWTETPTGVTRHHMGPSGKPSHSTNEATGATLPGSNTASSPNELVFVPGRDAPMDGSTGPLQMGSSSFMATIADIFGGRLPGGFFDSGRDTTTNSAGFTVYVPNDTPISSPQFGAPSVATASLLASSVDAYVAGAIAEVDSSPLVPIQLMTPEEAEKESGIFRVELHTYQQYFPSRNVDPMGRSTQIPTDRSIAVAVLRALAIIGSSSVPYVGEADDALTMADPNEKAWVRMLSGISLYISPYTGGVLPNFGTMMRAFRGAVDELRAVERAVPNPHGSRGCQAHRETIDRRIQELQDQGYEHLHGGSLPESAIKIDGGHKSSRRPDITMRAPDGTIYHENVGRSTKEGNPIARERRALDDIERATGQRPGYTPYDRERR